MGKDIKLSVEQEKLEEDLKKLEREDVKLLENYSEEFNKTKDEKYLLGLAQIFYTAIDPEVIIKPEINPFDHKRRQKPYAAPIKPPMVLRSRGSSPAPETLKFKLTEGPTHTIPGYHHIFLVDQTGKVIEPAKYADFGIAGVSTNFTGIDPPTGLIKFAGRTFKGQIKKGCGIEVTLTFRNPTLPLGIYFYSVCVASQVRYYDVAEQEQLYMNMYDHSITRKHEDELRKKGVLDFNYSIVLINITL